MSMLDLVRRAFAEGGSQLEALSGLLECKDLGPDLTTEEKVELALAEVLRLKSQLQTLQQQMSALMQDRERMNLLIWAELSRLSLKIEGGVALQSPVRSALLEDVSIKSDPILKAILSASNGCPLMGDAGGEEEVQSGGTPRSVVCPRGTKRHRVSSSVAACEDEAVPLRSSSSLCGRSPPSGCSLSTGEGGSCGDEVEGGRRGGGCDVPSEQRMLIDTWIEKQRSGFESACGGGAYQTPWSLISGEVWRCYVCNSESREPPGDHFCVGKYEAGQREGLKVFCQYCRKGTARMPDLRVHFKKIVYCRVLREELKKQISIKNEEDQHTSSTEENRSGSSEERSCDEPCSEDPTNNTDSLHTAL